MFIFTWCSNTYSQYLKSLICLPILLKFIITNNLYPNYLNPLYFGNFFQKPFISIITKKNPVSYNLSTPLFSFISTTILYILALWCQIVHFFLTCVLYYYFFFFYSRNINSKITQTSLNHFSITVCIHCMFNNNIY